MFGENRSNTEKIGISQGGKPEQNPNLMAIFFFPTTLDGLPTGYDFAKQQPDVPPHRLPHPSIASEP